MKNTMEYVIELAPWVALVLTALILRKPLLRLRKITLQKLEIVSAEEKRDI